MHPHTSSRPWRLSCAYRTPCRYKHCIVYTGHRSNDCRCIFNWTVSKDKGVKQGEPERWEQAYLPNEATGAPVRFVKRTNERSSSLRRKLHLNKAKDRSNGTLKLPFCASAHAFHCRNQQPLARGTAAVPFQDPIVRNGRVLFGLWWETLVKPAARTSHNVAPAYFIPLLVSASGHGSFLSKATPGLWKRESPQILVQPH